MSSRRELHSFQQRYRGFSFTEILFAVIVLGIGFIMVAAIFPVAIQQGKLTSEEGTATAVARESLGYLAQIGANSDAIANAQGGPLFPATGVAGTAAPYLGLVYSMRDPQPTGVTNTLDSPAAPTLNHQLTAVAANASPDNLWNRLKLNLITPSDQRYAFVGLYRRNGDPNDRRTWAPFAQCWFIPVTVRARTLFDAGTPAMPGADVSGTNLIARPVKVQITDPNGIFSTSGTGGYVLYSYASASGASSLSENCFVIIANDQSTGRMNGHIYHVGLRRVDKDGSDANGSYTAYDLVPNGDFLPEAGADAISNTPDDIVAVGNTVAAGTVSTVVAAAPADAYVVGLQSGADPGTSQDISAFTTFIRVN